MKLAFRSCPLDEQPALSLATAMRAGMAELYDGLNIDDSSMPAAGPSELGPPGGAFIVGIDADGQALCCGDIKRLGDTICELKRMYVAPDARGQGVGRALLEALEATARGLGYTVARLDTGPRQPRAERMYRMAGYRPIDNFSSNPVAMFLGEKSLD